MTPRQALRILADGPADREDLCEAVEDLNSPDPIVFKAIVRGKVDRVVEAITVLANAPHEEKVYLIWKFLDPFWVKSEAVAEGGYNYDFSTPWLRKNVTPEMIERRHAEQERAHGGGDA